MKRTRLLVILLGLGISACGGGGPGTSEPVSTQFELQVIVTGQPGPIQFVWQGQSFSISASQTLQSRLGETLTEPSGYVFPADYHCDISFTKRSALAGSLQLSCKTLPQFSLQLDVTGNTAPLSFKWFDKTYQLNQQLTLTQRASRYEAPIDWTFPTGNSCQPTQSQDNPTHYRISWACSAGPLSVQVPQTLPYTAYLRHQDKVIALKNAGTLQLDNKGTATAPQLNGSDGPQHCALQQKTAQQWQLHCDEFAAVYGKTSTDSPVALVLLQQDGHSVMLHHQPAPDQAVLSANQQLYTLQADGLHQLKANNGRYEAGPLVLADATGMALAYRPAEAAQLLAITPKTLYRLDQDQWVRLRDTPGTPFQAPLYGGMNRVSWLSQAEPGKGLSLWQRVAGDQNRFASVPAGRRSAASGAILLPDRLELSGTEPADMLIWPTWEQNDLVLDYLASSKVELVRLPLSQSPTLWQTAPHTAAITRLFNGQIELYRYNAAQGFFWQSAGASSGNWLAGTETVLLAGQAVDGMVTLTSLQRAPNQNLLADLQQASSSSAPLQIAAARNGRSDETGLTPRLANAGWTLLYQAGTVWLSDGTLLHRVASNISSTQYLQWQLPAVGNTLAVVRNHDQVLLPIALR